MILKKTEPLTGKLDIHKDVPVMGKGMMVEVSTWRATMSFCSIVKKFSGTFSRKVSNRRMGVGGFGSQDQNLVKRWKQDAPS